MNDLESFFAGRTIGYSSTGSGLHWRGRSGYDEGWEPLTADETYHLYLLLRKQ